MSRQIISEADFIELLKREGWKSMDGRAWYQCPYDKDVHFSAWERRFYKSIPLNKPNRYGHTTESRILGTIPNFKHIIWNYEEESGVMENGIFAIRIR